MRRATAWGCAAALMLASTCAAAWIHVVPANPTPTQSVRIRLVNQYGSEASITSAAIGRNGNQFIIDQAVLLICPLPSAPILVSEFDVGALPAGTYQVTAQIRYASPFPSCGGHSEIQTAGFVVGDPAAVPVLGPAGYLVLGCLLLLGAMRAGVGK